MPAPAELLTLIDRFSRNYATYHKSDYNETQLRIDFLNPLLELLGWDVANKLGYAEDYRDVIHEFRVKVEGEKNTKAPDYCIKIGTAYKFFVEAKKPAENINSNHEHAFQLRRYAWSAKLPLSILTDFEELAVYDCRIKPNRLDKPTVARIMYVNYKELPERWEEFSGIFGKHAVLQGSFDRYAETAKKKRGTAEVDDTFLADIEEWRDWLAKDIAKRNSSLTVAELNDAVQRTIDRIIFLRIAEDRGIEDYGRLEALCKSKNVYAGLVDLYREADVKYNSGLFHFSNEKGQAEGPDTLTPGLTIDNKVLKDIFRRLYYPESPYAFSVLPASILGQVYEQFLGKVITLDNRHRATVELKPEVRKAGGVYYTPEYIARYIVENTIGRLVEGKTPADVAKLRFLDPACGSGSFLLVAYDFLLDWHLRYYTDHKPKQLAKAEGSPIYAAPTANETADPDAAHSISWRLTTAEKKRILLNNIYGVDIDRQAVEVTKLSLLLKMLEGENRQTLNPQKRLQAERVLPDLGNNIKCGNSLIGSDFYDDPANATLDLAAQQRINAFDWSHQFREIMKGGGFDAVIGNPPYGAWFTETEAHYFMDHFEVAKGVRDVYAFFIEKGSELLRSGGKLGYIVPSAWMGGPQYAALREYLLEWQVERLVLLPFDVFEEAYIDTTIVVVTAEEPHANHVVYTYEFGKRDKLTKINLLPDDFQQVKQSQWGQSEGQKFIIDPAAVNLLQRLTTNGSRTIKDVAQIRRGVLFDKSLLTDKRTGSDSFPYFEGDVYRYTLNLRTPHWIEFNDKLKERPKEFNWFDGERLLLRRLVNRQQRLMATYTDTTFITNKNLYSILPANGISPYVLLGVLNSRLISFLYLRQVTQATKDDFPQVTIKDMYALPFPSTKALNGRAGQLSTMTQQILTLQAQCDTVKSTHDRSFLETRIEQTDRQIDRLVYELYGLTEEEIAIVEGGND